MNKPIKFELAKLLKEKGFDKPCSHYYRGGHLLSFLHLQSSALKESKFKDRIKWLAKFPLGTSIYYEAPTIADVIMWLYETHGIWIYVDWMSRTSPYNSGFYSYLRGTNKPLNEDNWIPINDTLASGYHVFNSPTEAYETAIEYTLNNLI